MIRLSAWVLACLLLACGALGQSSWTFPDPVGQPAGLVAPPSSAFGGLHIIDLVYTNNDRHMFHQWADASRMLSTPQDIGFVGISTEVSLISNGQHKLDVFYQGPDGHLWTRWADETGKWSDGVSLGGDKLTSPPFAIANALHKMDVIFAGQDGKLVLSYWNGGQWWSGGIMLSNEILKQTPPGPNTPSFMIPRLPRWRPVATANSPHRIDVIYVVSQPDKPYGKLRTVFASGTPAGKPDGDWSAPADLNAGGSPAPNATFVNSSLAAISDQTSDGKWRGQIFFTVINDGVAHQGRIVELSSTGGSNWFNGSPAGPAGGNLLSAITPTEIFFAGNRTSVSDQDHISGLGRTCLLVTKNGVPEQIKDKCLILPGQQ